MSDVLGFVEQFKTMVVKVHELQQAIGALDGGPMDFCASEFLESFESIFHRYCPYEIGQTVYLKQHVVFDHCPGWRGADFLIADASAQVERRGYSHGRFEFGLVFELDPKSDKSVFLFHESDITGSPPPQAEKANTSI